MRLSPFKKIFYGAILAVLALLSLEILLGAFYFHARESSFATVDAFEEAWRLASGQSRGKLDDWIDLPDPLLRELAAIGGMIDNVNNPTGATKDDSPATEFSEGLGFKLRREIQIANHVLEAKQRPNLSPPVVQYASDKAVPRALENWLRTHAKLSYEFSTDALGHRRTVPRVEAARKILVVGDSVAFGLGVADEHTVASALQARVAPNYQVVNRGVPSYGAAQAYRVASDPVYSGRGHLLVYIACQNDFHGTTSGGQKFFDTESMRSWIAAFQKLEDEGAYAQVIVVLETYLEYSFDNFFAEWDAQRIASIREGLDAFDSLTDELGIDALNWNDLVEAYNSEQGTLFAGVGLYVDHVHLSPRGNRLLAEAVVAKIREPGIASAVPE